MLAPVTSPTPIRLVTPTPPQEVCVGVPSCGPLLQYELLKALQAQAPRAYAQAIRETGLTVERAEVLAKRGGIVSAARAIKLARLIAREPNGPEIFSEAGGSLSLSLYRELPFSLRLVIQALPRPLRLRLALSVTRHIAHGFAGGRGRLMVSREGGRLYVKAVDGVFSDRLETLTGACEFYRSLLETILRCFARVDGRVEEVKGIRRRLNECSFEVARRP